MKALKQHTVIFTVCLVRDVKLKITWENRHPLLVLSAIEAKGRKLQKMFQGDFVVPFWSKVQDLRIFDISIYNSI